MYRRSLLLPSIIALLTTATGVLAQDVGDHPDTTRLRRIVVDLTAPALAGREAGTPGEVAAGDSLAHWLAAAGLQPAFAGDWFQLFPLHGDSLTGRESRNTVGVIPGVGDLAGRWVVIAAHVDHLGRMPDVPADAVPAPGHYYPGANDNAAGVAAVVAATRVLAASKDGGPRRGVLVAGFGGEEAGLQGSAWFVDHLPVPRDSLDVMLNLDTIGRLTGDALYVGGVGTSPPLADMARAASGALPLRESRAGWSGGDHVSFLLHHIPAVALFGGPYAEYNSPADDVDVIDFVSVARVSGFAAQLADSMRRHDGPFPYVEVAPVNEAVSTDGNRSTWFGSVPDFGGDADGYRIGQVVAGGPAARAGLRDGDILVRLADDAVTDLATFTEALRRHAPGDPVDVTVERSGRPMRFTVVLGDRHDRGAP